MTGRRRRPRAPTPRASALLQPALELLPRAAPSPARGLRPPQPPCPACPSAGAACLTCARKPARRPPCAAPWSSMRWPARRRGSRWGPGGRARPAVSFRGSSAEALLLQHGRPTAPWGRRPWSPSCSPLGAPVESVEPPTQPQGQRRTPQPALQGRSWLAGGAAALGPTPRGEAGRALGGGSPHGSRLPLPGPPWYSEEGAENDPLGARQEGRPAGHRQNWGGGWRGCACPTSCAEKLLLCLQLRSAPRTASTAPVLRPVRLPAQTWLPRPPAAPPAWTAASASPASCSAALTACPSGSAAAPSWADTTRYPGSTLPRG